MSAATVCSSCIRGARRQVAKRAIRDYQAATSPCLASAPRVASFPRRRQYHGTPSWRQDTLAATRSGDFYAEKMRKQEPDVEEKYRAQTITETIFKECARQADYIIPQAFETGVEIPKNEKGEDVGEGTGWWYQKLGLAPTFNNWSQVTFLHLYLMTVRLRYFPASYSSIWLQHLHNHFFYEAEHRMNVFHRLTSNSVRQRYLKQLFEQWRGVQAAYDEGLMKGDAVLGAAVWRNIYQGSDDADWEKIAMIVSYMRRVLGALDRTPDRIILGARIRFGDPGDELVQAEEQSKGLQEPFTAEDELACQEALSTPAPAKT